MQRSNRVTDQFRESAEVLADVIGNRGDAVREMLAARLQSFEDMFNHGGAELAERIARDSTTLGNLITRHLAEFDRTVKTYGGEMVERLGERTQDISERDARLSRQFRHPRHHQVGRGHGEPRPAIRPLPRRARRPHADAQRSARLARHGHRQDDGRRRQGSGRGARQAHRRRHGVINVRGAKLAESIGAKIEDIDKALGVRAMEVADNLDTRIGRFEELLIGRAETVTKEIEARSQSAADLLAARTEHLSSTIRTNAGEAAHALEQLDHVVACEHDQQRRVEQLNNAIKSNTSEAERSIGNLATPTSTVIVAAIQQLSEAVKTNTAERRAHRSPSSPPTPRPRSASSAHDAERTLSGMSTGVSNVLKQNASEVERTLLAVSAEVARTFVGKADEISTAVSQRAAEMTHIVDEKSSGAAHRAHREEPGIRERGQPRHRPCGQGDRSQGLQLHPDHDGQQRADRAADQRGERDARPAPSTSSLKELQTSHSAATETTSEAVTRSIKDLRETAEMATQSAAKTITRTLRELQDTTTAAVEQSKQTASSAVSEIMETQNMLRSDTTALFERLREANILLQEVLSGAHENMSEIESTLVTRVADFVARHERGRDTRPARRTARSERSIASFQTMTTQALTDLSQLATPVRRAWPLAGGGGGADRHQQSAHRGHDCRTARPRSTSWSPRSTARATISSSGSRASPACSTSRSKARPNARARSPA